MLLNQPKKLKEEFFWQQDINSESTPISTKNIPMISKNMFNNGCGKMAYEESVKALVSGGH